MIYKAITVIADTLYRGINPHYQEQPLPFHNAQPGEPVICVKDTITDNKPSLTVTPPVRHDAYLICIETSRLAFANEPVTEDLGFWAGAEWHREKPVWKAESRRPEEIGSRVHNQTLWKLKSGSKLALTDMYGRQQLLYNHKGKLILRPVTPEEVAAYIIEHVRFSRNRRATEWAWRNLARLQKTYPELRLHGHIDRLQQR